MNFAKASRALGLITLAAISSPYAMADASEAYGGISAGRSRAKIDDGRITGNLLGGGLATTSITDDNRDTGYKIFGGYKFNENFAIEGGYFDLGKFGFSATTLPAGTLDGKIRIRGLNLDAVGIIPITKNFSAFGRLGLNHAQARDSFTGTGSVNVANPNPSKRETNGKIGLGLQYNFTESLGMRLEAERYRINDAVGNKGDINLVSLGLIFRFGDKAPAPAAAAPAPARMAVASPPPRPTPEPVVVMPPPAPRKISFSTDSIFDFDKSTLKPSGNQHLDKLAADLKGTSFDVITVTGHTDRIGAHDYNMKLSERRAEAVKAYLVDSAGIPAGKVVARGTNGSDPVTKPDECKGKKATPKLIACLQPDRRVEVEVTATQASR